MINLFEPHIDIDAARVYLDDSLDRGALTNSPDDSNPNYVNQLGIRIASLMGFKYGIPCSSGTVAAEVLITALLELLPRGVDSPVIHMPAYNYEGLINMVVDQAPKWDSAINLVSCSIDNYSANFDYGKYRHSHSLWINSYLYGNMGVYDNDNMCIGDLSHLTGVDCSGLGLDHGFTSLYPTKNIGAGEGGVVLTNNRPFSQRVAKLIASGGTSGRSYNRRMSELHAGVGLANAKGIKERMNRRRAVYTSLRGLIDEDFRPHKMRHPYMFIINLARNPGFNYEIGKLIVNELDDHGIGSSFDYYRGHLGPRLNSLADISYEGDGTAADNLMGTQLAIPCHRNMTEGDIRYTAESVNKALRELL